MPVAPSSARMVTRTKRTSRDRLLESKSSCSVVSRRDDARPGRLPDTSCSHGETSSPPSRADVGNSAADAASVDVAARLCDETAGCAVCEMRDAR